MFFDGNYKTISSISGNLEGFFDELLSKYGDLSPPPARTLQDDLFSQEDLFLKNLPDTTMVVTSSPTRNLAQADAPNTEIVNSSMIIDTVEAVSSAIRTGDDRFFDFIYYLINKKPIYITEVNERLSLMEAASTLWNFKYAVTAAAKEIIQCIRYGFSGGYVFYQMERIPSDRSSYLGTLIFSKEDQQLYYVASGGNEHEIILVHLKDLSEVELSRIKKESVPVDNGSWMFLSVKQAHELTGNEHFRLESGVLCPADFFPGTTEERLSRTLNGLQLEDKALRFYEWIARYHAGNAAVSFQEQLIQTLSEKKPCVLSSLNEEELSVLHRALIEYQEENPDTPLVWVKWLSAKWRETELKEIEFSEEVIRELTVFLNATGKESLAHTLMAAFETLQSENTNRLRKIRDTAFCDDQVLEEAMDLLKRPILRVSENGYIINLQDCHRFAEANPIFVLENKDGYYQVLSPSVEHSESTILANYMAYRKLSFPFPWWSDDVYQKMLLVRFSQIKPMLVDVFKKVTFGRELDANDNPENQKKLEEYTKIFLQAIAFYLPLDEEAFQSSYWAISLEERKNLPVNMKTFLQIVSRAEVIASDVLNELRIDLSETMNNAFSRRALEMENDLTTLLLSRNKDYFDKIPLSCRDKLDELVRAEHHINTPRKIFRLKQLKTAEVNLVIELISGSREELRIIWEKIQADDRRHLYLSEEEIKAIKDRLDTALNITGDESRKKSLIALGKKLVCERTKLPLTLCRPIYERELKKLYNCVPYETVDVGASTLLLLALQYGNVRLFEKLFQQFSGGYDQINIEQVSAKHYHLNNFSDALREKDRYPQAVRYTEKKLRQYLEDWCFDAAKIAHRNALVEHDRMAALVDGVLQRLDSVFRMRTIFLSREEQVKKLIEIIEKARYSGWHGQDYINEIQEVMETIEPGFLRGSSTLHTSRQFVRELRRSVGPIGSVVMRSSYGDSEPSPRDSRARPESVSQEDSPIQARLSEFAERQAESDRKLAEEKAERERDRLEAEAQRERDRLEADRKLAALEAQRERDRLEAEAQRERDRC